MFAKPIVFAVNELEHNQQHPSPPNTPLPHIFAPNHDVKQRCNEYQGVTTLVKFKHAAQELPNTSPKTSPLHGINPKIIARLLPFASEFLVKLYILSFA